MSEEKKEVVTEGWVPDKEQKASKKKKSSGKGKKIAGTDDQSGPTM